MTTATTNQLNLNGVTDFARAGVSELAEVLRQFLGDDFHALTVFGAAVTTDFGPRARIRTVAVLKNVHVAGLAQMAPKGPHLGRHRLEAPLIVTPQYVAESLDAFPVEFLEIHQVHHTVLGPDIFADLEFQNQHMRLQCEREFKRMLIRLRQGILAAAGKVSQLGELLDDLSGHGARVLRGVLWLHGDRRPLAPHTLWVEAGDFLKLDLSAADRTRGSSAPPTIADVERVYHTLEQLAEKVNAL
jgi:hypothetical protein